MMVNMLVWSALSFEAAGRPDIDAAQFARLVQGQLADFRDVTLLYEGGVDYVGPATLFEQPAASMKQNYQGIFRLRADGAGLVDIYLHKYDNTGNMLPLVRETYSYANHVKESSTRIPDLRQIIDEKLPSGPSCVFNTGSYGRILFHWYILALKDPLASGYGFLGWEKVEGRNCLKVQFRAQGKAPPENTVAEVFWIDLDRGGIPLKHEYYRGKILMSRVDEIKVDRFEAKDGKKLWLPYSGRYLSFGWNGRPDGKPLFIETYDIVVGSLRLNEGLADPDLSIKARPDLLGSERLAADRRDTQAIVPTAPGRSDPASVKARLDEQLKEADRQSKQIEASSPERTAWSAVLIVQGSLIAAGLILATAGLFWRMKRA